MHREQLLKLKDGIPPKQPNSEADLPDSNLAPPFYKQQVAGTPIDVGSAFQLYALINPDNEEDLFIVITGNSTGEIYRYDHTSIPHETTDNDKSENNTSSILESEDDDYGQEDELVSTPENTDHEISRPEEDTTSTGKVTTPELIINETDQTVNSKYFSLSGYATDENYSVRPAMWVRLY